MNKLSRKAEIDGMLPKSGGIPYGWKVKYPVSACTAKSKTRTFAMRRMFSIFSPVMLSSGG
jgi:hypothetical protein